MRPGRLGKAQSAAWIACLGGCLVSAAGLAQDATRFETDIQGFERADQASPPPPEPVVFVGSSSIRAWAGLRSDFPEYAVLNRSFGGSHMSDLLYYFDRVVAAYAPSVVVVYEGDNDLAGGKPVAQVLADYEEFLDRVRQAIPGTGVFLLAVKPSPSRAANLDAQRALNMRLEALASSDPGVEFIDVFTPMLGDDGQPRRELFQSDMLHLNATGYALWKSLVGSVLDAWLGSSGVTDRTMRPWLIDFGAGGSPTGQGPTPDDPAFLWNNVTEAIGAAPSGRLLNLVNRAGVHTEAGLLILRRFNGSSQSDPTESGLFPGNATRDSLYGNTETFSGRSRVFPAFRLIGLDPALAYDLTFYASRPGVDDNRETTYTAMGASTAEATLNPANNVTDTAEIVAMSPAPNGGITIALSPSPDNNNGNHFTYLGVMRITPKLPDSRMDTPLLENGEIRLNWNGPGRLQSAPSVTGPWRDVEPAPSALHLIPINAAPGQFFRLSSGSD